MRELGVAGEAHEADRLAGCHSLAGLHDDAALPEMAVLGLPAPAMVDDQRVPGFPILHGVGAGRADAHVIHAVAQSQHRTRCRSQHLHALGHDGAVRNPDIRALVTVIGEAAASPVLGLRAGIIIDEVADHAADVRRAGDRQVEAGAARLPLDGPSQGDEGTSGKYRDRD